MFTQPDNIVGLDFETYYDSKYSLRAKGTSTTEYIRDKRFKIQCVGVRSSDEKEAKWYANSAIEEVLRRIDWSRTGLLCHHTQFDGLILNHHFGITPAYYYDTLSMARPLHGGAVDNNLDSVSVYYGGEGKQKDVLEKTKGIRDLPDDILEELGSYCAQDVDEMWRIFEQMRPQFPDPELDLIHLTVRAYCEPVIQVNKSIARKVHKEEVKAREALLEKVGHDHKVLNSRKQFAELLRNLGIEPPTKPSPSDPKKRTYAFAKNDLALQELQRHSDEQVRNLVEARLVASSSIEETRAARVLSHADPALPIYLNYGQAHTLRWTGGDKMNPQNFGRDSELRHSLKPPKGHKFVVVDSSQIEARVNATLAGETRLIEAFRNDEDIYSEFAGETVYNMPVNKQDNPTERFVGKTCILGLGYQMGVDKIKYTLESGSQGPAVVLDEDKYSKAVYGYRRKFKRIVAQWSTMQNLIHTLWKGGEVNYGPLMFRKEHIDLPNGLFLRYPGVKPTKIIEPINNGFFKEAEPRYDDFRYNGNMKLYGGLLTENIVQALARIVVAEQILKVAHKYRVVLLVHDEVVLAVPTKSANKALEETLEAFSIAPDWMPELPVAGEGKVVDYYRKL